VTIGHGGLDLVFSNRSPRRLRLSSWHRIRPWPRPPDRPLSRSHFRIQHIGAREKLRVVAPGIRQVTVTSVSFSSARNAKEKESMKAFDRYKPPEMSPG